MRAIAIILGLLLFASPSFAADFPYWTTENPSANPGIYLKKGQPAPEDGAFFSGDAAIELLEKLRDAKSAKEKVDALLKELEFKEQQVNELLAAKQAEHEALERANEIITNLREVNLKQQKIIEEYQRLLEQSQEQNKKLVERVEAAESRTFWERIWTAVLVIGLAAIGIAF